jgi:hypothetical protein
MLKYLYTTFPLIYPYLIAALYAAPPTYFAYKKNTPMCIFTLVFSVVVAVVQWSPIYAIRPEANEPKGHSGWGEATLTPVAGNSNSIRMLRLP